MEMQIDFPGGDRVDAHFGPYTVFTDQPSPQDGEGSAPTPFELFLASIGTCAGIYALGFCRQRGLPTEGLRLLQRVSAHPSTGMIERIELEIVLPADFPDKYKPAMIHTVELCKVKKHLLHPPAFEIHTAQAAPALPG
jgi:ribosomal protein S12 methylthiotransferase accessory factor